MSTIILPAFESTIRYSFNLPPCTFDSDKAYCSKRLVEDIIECANQKVRQVIAVYIPTKVLKVASSLKYEGVFIFVTSRIADFYASSLKFDENCDFSNFTVDKEFDFSDSFLVNTCWLCHHCGDVHMDDGDACIAVFAKSLKFKAESSSIASKPADFPSSLPNPPSTDFPAFPTNFPTPAPFPLAANCMYPPPYPHPSINLMPYSFPPHPIYPLADPVNFPFNRFTMNLPHSFVLYPPNESNLMRKDTRVWPLTDVEYQPPPYQQTESNSCLPMNNVNTEYYENQQYGNIRYHFEAIVKEVQHIFLNEIQNQISLIESFWRRIWNVYLLRLSIQ